VAAVSAIHSATGQRPPPSPPELAAAISGAPAPTSATVIGSVSGVGASVADPSGLQQESSVSRISRPSTSERSLITVSSKDEYDLESELRHMLNDERALSVSRSLPVLRQGKVRLPLGGLAGRFEGLPSTTKVCASIALYVFVSLPQADPYLTPHPAYSLPRHNHVWVSYCISVMCFVPRSVNTSDQRIPTPGNLGTSPGCECCCCNVWQSCPRGSPSAQERRRPVTRQRRSRCTRRG
jgi:hypothetical protein